MNIVVHWMSYIQQINWNKLLQEKNSMLKIILFPFSSASKTHTDKKVFQKQGG